MVVICTFRGCGEAARLSDSPADTQLVGGSRVAMASPDILPLVPGQTAGRGVCSRGSARLGWSERGSWGGCRPTAQTQLRTAVIHTLLLLIPGSGVSAAQQESGPGGEGQAAPLPLESGNLEAALAPGPRDSSRPLVGRACSGCPGREGAATGQGRESALGPVRPQAGGLEAQPGQYQAPVETRLALSPSESRGRGLPARRGRTCSSPP